MFYDQDRFKNNQDFHLDCTFEAATGVNYFQVDYSVKQFIFHPLTVAIFTLFLSTKRWSCVHPTLSTAWDSHHKTISLIYGFVVKY